MNIYSVATTVAKSSLDSHKLLIFPPSFLSGVNRSVTRSKYSVANQTLCSFQKKLEYADKEHKTYKNSRYVYTVFFYTLRTKGQKTLLFCKNNLYAIVLVKGQAGFLI